MTASLIERRDAKQIKQLARDLCVSVETVPTGDGRYFTVAPVSFLLQLRDAFGDEGMADVYAVVDGPALRALKPPAGIRSLDDELRALREAEERKHERPTSATSAAIPTAPPAPPTPPSLSKEKEREAIRDEVRAAKDALGLSIKEFAELLSVSPSAVTFWLQGRFRPTADKLALIRLTVGDRAKGRPA